MNQLIIVAIGLLIMIFIGTMVYVYGYDLTQNDTDEERILQICIHSDIKLDYCHNLYGGINTEYGEAIK